MSNPARCSNSERFCALQHIGATMIRLCLQVLAPYAKQININNDVMDMYLRHLLPGITGGGDDGNYGSSACYDVLCLQVPRFTALCILLAERAVASMHLVGAVMPCWLDHEQVQHTALSCCLWESVK